MGNKVIQLRHLLIVLMLALFILNNAENTQAADSIGPSLVLETSAEELRTAIFSPDGKYIVSAEDVLRLWDAQTGRELLANDGCAPYVPYSLNFTADGKQLLYACDDGALRIWNIEQARTTGAFTPDQVTELVRKSFIRNTRFSPDGQMILGVDYATAYVWDASTGDELLALRHSNEVYAAVFSPDGKHILTKDYQNDIYLWDVLTGEGERVSLQSPGYVGDAFFSSDGHTILTLVSGGISILNLETQAEIVIEQGSYDNILPCPDSPCLVAVSFRDLGIFDIETGEKIFSIGGNYDGAYLRFSPVGNLLAAIPEGASEVQIIDRQSQQVVLNLVGHEAEVHTIHFSPDGRYAVTAAADGTARVWDLSSVVHEVEVAQNDSATNIENTESGTALGTTTATLTGYADPRSEAGCTIRAGETLLALARRQQSFLVYAGGVGCEGLVWVEAGPQQIAWVNQDAAYSLPTIPFPITPPPLEAEALGNRYYDICTNATFTSAWPSDRYLTVFAEHLQSDLPASLLATDIEDIDILVCREYKGVELQRCPYTGGYTLIRMRDDQVVKLVNYETGGYMATQTFRGENPQACSSTVYVDINATEDYSYGLPAPDEALAAWAVETIHDHITGSAARTVINTDTLNARSEPSTDAEILDRLPRGTPVNLIGRNEAGDWVVALLPDMSKAWLFTDYLRIAPQTDVNALAVFSGAAGNVPIVLPE
jgi:WD40 repeat protein